MYVVKDSQTKPRAGGLAENDSWCTGTARHGHGESREISPCAPVPNLTGGRPTSHTYGNDCAGPRREYDINT